MRHALIGLLAGTSLASATAAQCTISTLPTQLAVSTWSGSPVGSTFLAADDGIIVTNYTWPNSGYPLPFIQVDRRIATGWQRKLYGSFRDTREVAVRDNFIAWTVAGQRVAGVAVNVPQVYVYINQPPSSDWFDTAAIDGPSLTELRFGRGLALSGSNPTRSLVFSTQDPDTYAEQAFVYTIDAEGAATLSQTIQDPEPSVDHRFGEHTGIDGDLLAIGTPGDDQAGPNAGAVYIYRRIAGTWSQVQKITPDPTTTSIHFAYSVALRDSYLVVGALNAGAIYGDVTGSNFSNGFARVYHWNGASFDLEAHVTNPNAPQVDRTGFATSVAVRGDRILIGAFQDSAYGTNAGAAYFYQRTGALWQPRAALGLPNGAGGWFGNTVALTSDLALANAPFQNQGQLAVAIFDQCSLPPLPGEPARCLPGISGLVSFLINWFQHDPVADFDRDGVVTSNDIFAFLTDWLAGCP